MITEIEGYIEQVEELDKEKDKLLEKLKDVVDLKKMVPEIMNADHLQTGWHKPSGKQENRMDSYILRVSFGEETEYCSFSELTPRFKGHLYNFIKDHGLTREGKILDNKGRTIHNPRSFGWWD